MPPDVSRTDRSQGALWWVVGLGGGLTVFLIAGAALVLTALVAFVVLAGVILLRLATAGGPAEPPPAPPTVPMVRLDHCGEVGCLLFSHDGRYLIAGSRGTLQDFGDFWLGEVRVWETATGRQVASARFGQWVRELALSPDGVTLAVSCFATDRGTARGFWGFVEQPGEVHLLDFPALRPRRKKTFGGEVGTVRFSSDGQTLAIVESPERRGVGGISLLDSATLAQRATIPGKYFTTPLAYDPGGKSLFVLQTPQGRRGTGSAHIVECDAATGAVVRTLEPKLPRGGAKMELSPDGKEMLVFSSSVALVDLERGILLRSDDLGSAIGYPLRGCYSSDGKYILAVSSRADRPWQRTKVALWDRAARKAETVYEQRSPELHNCCAYSPDGRHFAVGMSWASRDKAHILLFDAPGKR